MFNIRFEDVLDLGKKIPELQKSGIYQITCGKKFYIGKTKNFYNRWRRHVKALENNTHHSPYLQNSFNKYGEERIVFSIIEEVSIGDLGAREDYYIRTLKPCYNTYGSEGRNKPKPKTRIIGPLPKRCGSEKQRLAVIAQNKSRLYTDELRKKMSMAKKGCKMPPRTQEYRDNMRKRNLGKTVSQETRLKLSISNGRKVLQLDKDTMEVLHEYSSLNKAAQAVGMQRSSIQRICDGIIKNPKLYQWKWGD